MPDKFKSRGRRRFVLRKWGEGGGVGSARGAYRLIWRESGENPGGAMQKIGAKDHEQEPCLQNSLLFP